MSSDYLSVLVERVAEKYGLWNPEEVCESRKFAQEKPNVYICGSCKRMSLADPEVVPIPSFIFKTHIRRCPSFYEADNLFALLQIYFNIPNGRDGVLLRILSDLDKRDEEPKDKNH